MKIKLFILFLAALFILTGSAAESFAQKIPATGSYSEADVKNKEVITAAEFAAQTQSKKQKRTIRVVSINTAKTQVVAGTNYQFCMEVSVKKKSAKTAVNQFVNAVVHRNLQNKFTLTSWTTVAEAATCESN
jgi:hypothetical protein